MDDDGQMILLSALVACLCLLAVVACVAAIDDSAYMVNGNLNDHMDNVEWAQDCALRRAAFYSSTYPWDSRADAALRFKSEANSSMESLAIELLKRGVVYRLSFNASLASDFVAARPGSGIVSADGVLVEPAGGSARICGCAYDVFASDGAATYRASRVATFD